MQIFWNCVVTEAVIQFLWSGTSTSTDTECYDENVANSTVPNGTAANAHRALAHRGEAGGTDRSVGGGCTAGNQKIVTMVITGMFAAACLITTAVVCRIAFRLGNQPTRRRWVRVARHAAAWAFNLGFWAGGCWVIAAYGSCMGREETDEIIIGSLVGFGVSWMLMEPLWIVLITLAPCMCDTRFMRWMNDRANDIGLDLSLLLGARRSTLAVNTPNKAVRPSKSLSPSKKTPEERYTHNARGGKGENANRDYGASFQCVVRWCVNC